MHDIDGTGKKNDSMEKRLQQYSLLQKKHIILY